MKLYLVQHGEAVSGDINPSRPLTKKGREDVEKIANFIKESGIKIDIIWHSTKTRAIETAQIFAQKLSQGVLIEQKEGLSPNDPIKNIFEEIMACKADIMIVGHLPFLQKLASFALVNDESSSMVVFRQGGIICMERNESGQWQLIFALPPDIAG